MSTRRIADEGPYVIEACHLRMLDRVAKRLYPETRMSGDEMRNAAQQIDCVIDAADLYKKGDRG